MGGACKAVDQPWMELREWPCAPCQRALALAAGHGEGKIPELRRHRRDQGREWPVNAF